jgi:hypothetical protein
MIFSSFFKSKPNWQHKDSNIRITAINDDLDNSQTAHHDILITLVNEDPTEIVRRAALVKLNNFDLFLQASKYNSNDKVKQFCNTQIMSVLAGTHQLTLSPKQKNSFLTSDDATVSLLEHWLAHESASDVIIRLFEQLSLKKQNSNLLLQTFVKKPFAEVQKYLVSQVDDLKLLEKLHKKSCNSDVSTIISDKTFMIIEAAEKPLKLKKQLQLVLSKLLALKENLDYGTYLSKKALLEQEWQEHQKDMVCLSEEDKVTIDEKFQQISTQLTTIYAAKVEAFEQQKIAEKLAFDKQQAKAYFSKELNTVNQALTTAVFESDSFDSDTLDEKIFTATLQKLSAEILASVLNTPEQSVFSKQITQLNEKLGKLPEIAQCVSDATALISRISQLALPENFEQLNERQEVFNQWLVDWKAIEKKTKGVLPNSIKDSQQQIVSLWQTGLKPLQTEQKSIFFQSKKKLNDIKRLLSGGKYKVCFGLFKGLKDDYILLSAKQQGQLQRDYDAVEAKIAELSDWEHYIATPRKQELLVEINALVITPLDNPNEQAEKVKLFRKTWNSLGHADEEIDKTLNEEFNNACEQAFAPCREFYAEQDKLREQHLINRHKILVDADRLVAKLNTGEAEQGVDFKLLDAQLNKLQHNWQHAGEIDRSEYKKLQNRFKETIQPIKTAISEFHQKNIHAKKALITQAEALVDSDDVFNAIELVKKLQQEWRDIGFAGNHQESKLWKKFRTINDDVFAKRQQEKSLQQALISQQEILFTEQLELLTSHLSKSDVLTKSELLQSQQQAHKLLKEVTSQRPVIKSLINKIEKHLTTIELNIAEVEASEKKSQLSSLFSLISQLPASNYTIDSLKNNEQYQAIASVWQKCLREQIALGKVADKQARLEKTLEIEILAQATSPEEFSEQRMVVQVKLMQTQMASGTKISLNDSFAQWLALGTITEDDLALLPRLKAIYCQ